MDLSPDLAIRRCTPPWRVQQQSRASVCALRISLPRDKIFASFPSIARRSADSRPCHPWSADSMKVLALLLWVLWVPNAAFAQTARGPDHGACSHARARRPYTGCGVRLTGGEPGASVSPGSTCRSNLFRRGLGLHKRSRTRSGVRGRKKAAPRRSRCAAPWLKATEGSTRLGETPSAGVAYLHVLTDDVLSLFQAVATSSRLRSEQAVGTGLRVGLYRHGGPHVDSRESIGPASPDSTWNSTESTVIHGISGARQPGAERCGTFLAAHQWIPP